MLNIYEIMSIDTYRITLNINIQLFRYFEKLYTCNLLSTKVIFRIGTHVTSL